MFLTLLSLLNLGIIAYALYEVRQLKELLKKNCDCKVSLDKEDCQLLKKAKNFVNGFKKDDNHE